VRVEHQEELAKILEAKFSTRNREYWLTLLRTAGVPSCPVYRYSEALSSEHVTATGLVSSVKVEDFRPMPFVIFTVKVDRRHLSLPGSPPASRKLHVKAS